MRMLLFGSVLLALAGGCSPYVDDYQYVPRPALTEIRANPPQSSPVVSALATVIGVRRADRQQRIPESVQVRLRLENNGPQTVVFDPKSLNLVNGMLTNFPPPVTPPEPVSLAPMDSMIVEAYFPFPPGHSYQDTDLESLQLRWQIQIDGHVVGQSAYFRRIYPVHYYYGPYWYDPPYPVFGGVVIVHRRR